MMQGPLDSLEQWDDFVKARYDPNRKTDDFRQFTPEAPAGVRDFYRLNHANQTVAFVTAKKAEYLPLRHKKMGIWEAMEHLDSLVDDSDPDTDLSQIEHAMQTAEAIRAEGYPGWFILTGLIHDLGKVLCLFNEPQWAVVGDTFPVGCAWSDRIVYHHYFASNPDANVPEYQTECGIYERGCGLDQVDLSWGHDEYLYHVTKPYLPEPAQYMIRYHSFYPGHREGAYQHLMSDHDREMFEWVRKFNPFDLYSKSHTRPDAKALKPYYQDLIAEYFPAKVDW